MDNSGISAEKYADILRNNKKAQQSLSILGKYRPFIDATNTEVGQELLKDAVGLHEQLLEKMANLEATPEDIMEYKAVRHIIHKWSDRISNYLAAQGEWNKNAQSV